MWVLQRVMDLNSKSHIQQLKAFQNALPSCGSYDGSESHIQQLKAFRNALRGKVHQIKRCQECGKNFNLENAEFVMAYSSSVVDNVFGILN